MVTSGWLSRHEPPRREAPLPGIKLYCVHKMPFPDAVLCGYNLLDRISCLQYSDVRYYWSITSWLFTLSKIECGMWKVEYRVKAEERGKV